jgi:hypothetical protein
MSLYTCYYTICWTYWYKLQIKWDYKKEEKEMKHTAIETQLGEISQL